MSVSVSRQSRPPRRRWRREGPTRVGPGVGRRLARPYGWLQGVTFVLQSVGVSVELLIQAVKGIDGGREVAVVVALDLSASALYGMIERDVDRFGKCELRLEQMIG